MSSCILRQPPQSPLRRALSIFQKVDQLREFLQLPKKAWVHIPQKATGIQGQVIALSSNPGGTFFFSSVAADLALRLGPDSERSGKIVCKK